MTTASTIDRKLWNYAGVLRDAGLSYGDYLEQLTNLLFLKMMHERTQPPYTLLPDYQPPPIPEDFDWPSLLARDGEELLARDGEELEAHYRLLLERLGRERGTRESSSAKRRSRSRTRPCCGGLWWTSSTGRTGRP